MGSATEEDQLISTPTLQLFCNTTNTHALMLSPPRSGTLTPPLYTSAAVPFRWEEEPGKPRGSTSFNALSIPKCLELPPRLLEANVSKLNSPTTVLEGPYAYMGKTRFKSSSFRIIRKECYGSFRQSCSPERRQLSAVVVSRRLKDRSFLGSCRWGRNGFRGKREFVGASYVFPNSSIDKEVEDKEVEKEDEETSRRNKVKITRIRQSGSFSAYTRSRFWATVFGSLKQVIPWGSRKLKKVI